MPYRQTLPDFLPVKDPRLLRKLRRVTKKELLQPRPSAEDLTISPYRTRGEILRAYGDTVVREIRKGAETGAPFVLLFSMPLRPNPGLEHAQRELLKGKIDLRNFYPSPVDEFADARGNPVPESFAGSMVGALKRLFIDPLVKKGLLPRDNVLSPLPSKRSKLERMLDITGGAQCLFGGLGWGGHVAMIEGDLAETTPDETEWRKLSFHHRSIAPVSVMQLALPVGGDWSYFPSHAHTIGPKEYIGARLRSMWWDGMQGSFSYQQFAARLALRGPVTPAVPASYVQRLPSEVHILEAVAEDLPEMRFREKAQRRAE